MMRYIGIEVDCYISNFQKFKLSSGRVVSRRYNVPAIDSYYDFHLFCILKGI